MKTAKKIISMALALALVLAMGTVAFAATVTVPQDDTHTYAAYQIFTGTQAESEGELGNVQWGTGINPAAFLAALQASTETAFAFGTGPDAVANVFADCVTAADVAAALGNFADGSAAAERFAKLAYANKTTVSTALAAGEAQVDDGYYLIVDETDLEGEYDANNPALLQLTGEIDIVSKTDIPTVDKEVHDEPADMELGHENTDGWGETADHELNEVFQFKLMAALPAEIEFDRYAAYEAKFTDEWSAGITYDGNVSVDVDGVELTANQYILTVDTTNRKMVIDIPDIKTITGVDLTDGADITVLYDAHLNENAIIANAQTIANGTADDNQNMVYLEYSNKPDATGLGKTSEDYVFVFTYESDNTKFDGEPDTDRSNVLAGAGFKLYKEVEGTTLWAVLNNNMITDWTEYENAADAPEGSASATEVTSDEDGKFYFIGLDVGTYYLKESTTPDGFTTCEDITVTVTATHVENIDATSATVQKDVDTPDPTAFNDVINNSGPALPETGGIGTLIFYIVGGLLMVGAVIFMIVRRRMTAYNN